MVLNKFLRFVIALHIWRVRFESDRLFGNSAARRFYLLGMEEWVRMQGCTIVAVCFGGENSTFVMGSRRRLCLRLHTDHYVLVRH
jgi:hypothetical protein